MENLSHNHSEACVLENSSIHTSNERKERKNSLRMTSCFVKQYLNTKLNISAIKLRRQQTTLLLICISKNAVAICGYNNDITKVN